MDKILVSACLLGNPVRYDGGAKPSANPHLLRWRHEGRLVSFCPEIAGGFATPRLPAEIEVGATAKDVLAGNGLVIDSARQNVTKGFIAGAQLALQVAQDTGCRYAILMDGSPSCGTGFIYAGHFDGTHKAGMGVTAVLLTQHGIKVWSEGEIDRLAAHLGDG